MHYQDFELEISKNVTDGSYLAKVRSDKGEAQESFTLPDASTIENLILKMRGFSRSSRAVNCPEILAARSFGELLFNRAFKNDIGNLFKSCLDGTSTDKGLRLKLILQNALELSALPWEFLYYPKNGDFLAHSPTTPIVRYLQHGNPIKPLAVSLPLKLLVAMASPSDVHPLDTAKERRELAQSLAQLEQDGKLQITWLEKTTVAKLAETLESDQFHLLHFIGHSHFDEIHREGALLLENSQGKSDCYEAGRLKVLLHDHHSLRLVVLNSCDGAKQDGQDPYSSIATTLMLAGIPAVIAMQFEISDQAAISFAREFYKWLAKGMAIDEAMGRARKYLYAVERNNVEWGTPVLYLRAMDGVLFSVGETGVKPKSEKPPFSKSVVSEVIKTEKLEENIFATNVQPIIPDQPQKTGKYIFTSNLVDKFGILITFLSLIVSFIFLVIIPTLYPKYQQDNNVNQKVLIAQKNALEQQLFENEQQLLKEDRAKFEQEKLTQTKQREEELKVKKELFSLEQQIFKNERENFNQEKVSAEQRVPIKINPTLSETIDDRASGLQTTLGNKSPIINSNGNVNVNIR